MTTQNIKRLLEFFKSSNQEHKIKIYAQELEAQVKTIEREGREVTPQLVERIDLVRSFLETPKEEVKETKEKIKNSK